MAEQKPSVGRIVHWFPDTADSQYNQVPHAAIITYVDFVETEIDLQIFVPLRFIGYNTMLQKVPFSETPKPGHWCWPPRV